MIIITTIISTFFNVAYATPNEYKTVYVDDNFIRFEISEEFTTGTYSFDFVPNLTGDYAFYFDRLQYEESPQITLSVLDGDRKIDLEYKQDIPYKNSETSTDGIYQSGEILSEEYEKGTSHVCNIYPKDYYRVADKLSLHAALEKGKTYTLQLDATGDFTLENIDVRCLNLPVSGKDNLISVLDFTDYEVVLKDMNGRYPLTGYMSWNAGARCIEYFNNDCEIIGNYRSNNLSSTKTSANPFVEGEITYNLNVTVPGEYKVTAYMRNTGKLEPEESITFPVYFDISTDGEPNYKNGEISGNVLTNTSDKPGYAYTSASKSFTLEKGTYNLHFKTEATKVQVNYFKIDYVPYDEAKVDDSFSRFEFSDTGKSFSAGQEKTLRFNPAKSGKYALYAGPANDLTELTLSVTDEDGNVLLANIVASDLSSTSLQRVEQESFTPINIELTEGKEYLINIKATGLKYGKNVGTLSYIDIRNLTTSVPSNSTIVSMLDYTMLYNANGDITPNKATADNTAHKWESVGGLSAGNYMSYHLGIKTEYTTVVRNSQLGYTLDFKRTGKYKVTVYGSNTNKISEGDSINLTADVSIGGKSCGTAYYGNSDMAEKDFEAKSLSAMECPNIIDVKAGVTEMVVTPNTGNSLDIHGIKIERFEPQINLSYDKSILTDATKLLTLTAEVSNRNAEDATLFSAQYDNMQRLIKLERIDNTSDAFEFTIEPDINVKTIETFLWDSAFSPVCKQATVVKNDGVALRVGNDREYKTIEGAVLKASELISESDVCIILDSGEYFIGNTIDLGAFTGENQLTIVSENTKNPAIISGGKHISGFELYENGIYRAKVDDDTVSRQLFVDGVRATRARSEGELENCEIITLDDNKKVLATSTDLSGITQPEVLELVYHEAWKTPRILADDINYDETLGKWVFKFTDNSANWSALIYNSVPVTTPEWIENSYSLLDEPGEWYLDTDADYLYYMPRPFEDMDNVDVVIPATEKLFSTTGTAEKPVKNITFKNINFSDTAWLKPSTVRAMKSAQNELSRDLSDTGRLIDGAIEFENAHNIEISECSFNHIGSIAVKMWGAVQNCKIEENEFYDISASAIAIGEVEDAEDEASKAALRNPPDNKSIKNISVKNNYIRKYGVDYHSSAAIGLGFLRDSEISHNEICDGMYSGIHYGWGWSEEIPIITQNLNLNNNYIHNVMNKDLYDGGAIYLLGNTSGDVAMNYVSGNYIKDVKNSFGSIYPDNGSCYWTFTNNVIDQSEFDSYIKETGRDKPGFYWLHSWSTDQKYIYAYDNYSTFKQYKDAGAFTDIEQAHIYENADWPEEALGIIDNSGIQKLKNISFDYGIQDVKFKERYQLEPGECAEINLLALTSKDMIYDLSQAEIYSVSSDEDVVTADGITVTGVGTGNAKVRIFILTNNSQRKELYEVCIDITVL